jgi:signal peptidase I
MSPERRPWVAALLSLVGGAGLGQVYNGKRLKAAAFLFGTLATAACGLWLMTVLPMRPFNIVLPFCAFPLPWIASIVDAARDARKLRDVPRPWYGRWYACAAVWLFVALVVGPVFVSVLKTTCLQAFKIPAASMEPTLLIGDHLLVDKAAYGVRLPLLSSVVLRPRPPARGDLAVFLYPTDRSREYIKRVIGLPGETVEICGKTVYVDGRPLNEPYAHYLSNSDGDLDGAGRSPWGPEKVPAGHVFVLGDNRDNSLDSRFFGWVPIADLRGKAKVVYFSWESTRREYSREDKSPAGSVRWARIGRVVR